MVINGINLDTFTVSYLDAALWSSNDESTPNGGEPLDKNYGIDDIHPATLAVMVEDCRLFQSVNEGWITDDNVIAGNYSADDLAGYHFWLTRNGHGVGFTLSDRWEDGAADRLYASSERFGEYNLYVGDDGRIHGMKG